jgi:calcineurin-like phosphoesterase family protein
MNIFLTSDHHFSQDDILTFKRDSKKMLRNFDSVPEMDEHMIEMHNKVVGKNDKCYFLGDLCSSSKAYNKIMPRLNGSKILIKGNHDTLKMSQYMKYFKDVRSCYKLDGFVLTHVPIHPGSLGNKTIANVHGHLHQRAVSTEIAALYGTESRSMEDTRYYNVSVERHFYTPVSFDDIKSLYS